MDVSTGGPDTAHDLLATDAITNLVVITCARRYMVVRSISCVAGATDSAEARKSEVEVTLR